MSDNRSIAFGRLIAIANVLGDRVLDKGVPSISSQYLDKIARQPEKTIEAIHRKLLDYTHKFGPEEMVLLDMFGEIMSSLNLEEFTNDPLGSGYLHSFYTQQNALNDVMGVEEAAELWGLSPGRIKNICAEGKLQARKIGKTWVIAKNQPNPKV
ncbi:type I-C CRISPR-associated protein Cas8c/Csd1 (plasmid) [Paenibacillus sonchi]|uniref:Type I-C CRISPR-associated protein Cas8c/Csd1 n=1 Tax=Paenibacillus sonchi TaxID=373687 RepID=A0A974PIU6_9BACL|nr:helix-turn-helix domain-containing protein [Paenibacillus sonchi]QQZ64490.1 type I-C CRISPR-associated protein Cas8c/Csd1 [Paenibacillus sonchi]